LIFNNLPDDGFLQMALTGEHFVPLVDFFVLFCDLIDAILESIVVNQRTAQADQSQCLHIWQLFTSC